MSVADQVMCVAVCAAGTSSTLPAHSDYHRMDSCFAME